jgi:outer membrane lipoprotein-sorting protein
MKTNKMILLFALTLALGLLASACAELNPNTEGQLMSALEAKQAEFKTCYESALERNRTTQGNVALQLDVCEETGEVTSSTVETSTIDDDDMNQCVATAADDIVLPEPPGVPVEGHYDIEFKFE